jgi:anti-sigma factor RsiW
MDINNDGCSRMDCAQLAAALVLAADDELEQDALLLVEAHLTDCAACRAQSALFRQTDRYLLTCGQALDGPSLSGPAARARLAGRLAALQREEPARWLRAGWPWAAVAPVFSIVAVAVWMVFAPWPRERESAGKAAFGPLFSNAGLSAGSTELNRVELPLSPVGNPFLDGSPAESVVLADVVVGPDGLPQTVRLAN